MSFPPTDPAEPSVTRHFMRPFKTVRDNAAAWVLLGLFVALPAGARINVVTLPGRDSVQLTIYNSADITLVKETRALTFRKGLNKLEFSWANTLIDPTSVEFKPLTHADAVDLLDVSFPPRVSNTLEWRIQSDFAGEVIVEIRYFTSGIGWDAGYVAEAARDEKAMTLAGSVRVTNHSGEDYENAQIRLVVGVIRLVEDILALAQQGQVAAQAGMPAATPAPVLMRAAKEESRTRMLGVDALMADKQKEIIKEGVSEYFLYTVEGRDTIPNGWAKRLPSFKTPEVPITSYYKFERERWNDQVMRYYRFTNSEPSKLGREPLPDGDVKAFRFITDDSLYAFVGRSAVKYIPVNESVEMELGADREVIVKPTLMNWNKTDLSFDNNGNVKGWTTRETWEFEVQNSKDIDVMLDIRRNFSGDWSLVTDAVYDKVDANKVKFVFPLKSREQRKFAYELTVKHGTNATR
ncbi:MAG: hypothetical protein QOF48_3108 [Verrucomicrobiota bacterium]|jgi:hypothetical protein